MGPGEETNQLDQAPAETKAAQEKAVVEETKEENQPPPPEEEKPPAEEDQPPQPPPPFIIYVDLHCPGCAKKIERSIMKITGVEGVVTDMSQNQVTIKGVVEPEAVCNMITKKTKRSAKVISPSPANQGEPIPDVVFSQVSGLTTVELIVNMHCEACAGQLKKKILKMRGVQTAETELASGKVIVTGTMDANKLVDYVYRRTKKQAQIVPQPEQEKPPEEPKPEEAKEPEKPAEEANKPEDKTEDNGDQQKEEKPAEEAPKEGGDSKKEGSDDGVAIGGGMVEEESMKRMMMYNYNYNPSNYYEYNYYQRPHYVIERIPAPQLFSDENPNACCIS